MATKSSRYKEKPCRHCGCTFLPSGSRAQYCSDDCRASAPPLPAELTGRPYQDLAGQRFGRLIVDQISTRRGSFKPRPGTKGTAKYGIYWLCVCDCGAVTRVPAADLTSGSCRSCGCLRNEATSARSSVKGEARWNWKGGLNQNGYSNTWIDGKNALVHRVVMERMLGRPLLPEETVHHINGIRHDNRPENLELWSGRQPRGQRVEDKVEWAVELLRLYAPDRLA